jgi:serine/threonine protein kinase
MQGGHEFKTEIELLSRVHHKNLVSLVGFCFDQGEQMLVYEFVPNGTLKDSLSGIPTFLHLLYSILSKKKRKKKNEFWYWLTLQVHYFIN